MNRPPLTDASQPPCQEAGPQTEISFFNYPAEVNPTAPFIPAWLDDLGLSTAQFRVLCRVARRGDCFESIPNIAKGCKLHPDTVASSLKQLIAIGLVTKEPHAGRPSVFRVDAAAAPTRNGCPPETDAHVSESVATTGKRRPTHPPETEADKGSPLKVLPKGRSAAARRFAPPTKNELWLEAAKLGLPVVEVEKFHAHYESNGWRVGRGPMQDWRAALRGWKLRWEERRESPTRKERNEHRPRNDRNAGTYA